MITLSKIAETLDRADGFPTRQDKTFHQLQAATRNGVLAGVRMDGRGMLAFIPLDVYRARIFTTLSRLSIEMAAVREIIEAATQDSRPAHYLRDWPERTRIEGHHQWRGFEDVVCGVQCGEQWELRIVLRAPGALRGEHLTARFVWLDSPDEHLSPRHKEDAAQIGAIGRVKATVALDLNTLFAGLQGIV